MQALLPMRAEMATIVIELRLWKSMLHCVP